MVGTSILGSFLIPIDTLIKNMEQEHRFSRIFRAHLLVDVTISNLPDTLQKMTNYLLVS